MLEPTPDLLLPAAVEVLSRILHAGFPRGREDGGDAEAGTQPDDASQRITMLMRALKAVVVVELRVGRQAEFPPVGLQVRDDGASGKRGPRPSPWKRGVNRGDGQDFDFRAIGQIQPFDDVKAVEFGVALRNRG